jgi:ribosomal protein S17E
MDYDTFKLRVFNIIQNTSKTIIERYLHKLANDFNIPYDIVLEEFNLYSCYMWEESL